MTIVFQNCFPKHPNKEFLFLILRILIFAQSFALRTIDNDLKCDYIFLKFQPNTPKESIFGPGFNNFYFHTKFRN